MSRLRRHRRIRLHDSPRHMSEYMLEPGHGIDCDMTWRPLIYCCVTGARRNLKKLRQVDSWTTI